MKIASAPRKGKKGWYGLENHDEVRDLDQDMPLRFF